MNCSPNSKVVIENNTYLIKRLLSTTSEETVFWAIDLKNNIGVEISLEEIVNATKATNDQAIEVYKLLEGCTNDAQEKQEIKHAIEVLTLLK